MTEQWQELKETITELRDNDGTGTQQEVNKFLVNLMDVLEKKMSSSEKPSQWIPCSERLPRLDEEVLATTAWNDITMAWRIGIDKWFIHEGNTNATTEDLIAWCPLPEPYKGEDNG